MKKTAIAAGLVLILGCSGKPEGLAGKKDIYITPNSISVIENFNSEGIQKNTLEWARGAQDFPENGWASLKFWDESGRNRTRIYAKGTLTNPDFYKICPAENNKCIEESSGQFPFYVQGAMNDWNAYCHRFNCKKLEQDWIDGNFTK